MATETLVREVDFIIAINADRYDYVTHAAYADWLQEQGREGEASRRRLIKADAERIAKYLPLHPELRDATEKSLRSRLRYHAKRRGLYAYLHIYFISEWLISNEKRTVQLYQGPTTLGALLWLMHEWTPSEQR